VKPAACVRPRFGWWGGRFYVSVCIGGYGLSFGFLWKHPDRDDWLLIRPFRNYAYRGFRGR
jgi:hypothetical protein